MNNEQIQKYQYCSKYLERLNTLSKESPFKAQEFGCGSRNPSIEFRLQLIHRSMYDKIQNAIKEAKNLVEKEIEKI